jgi:RNA polymerase sigma-70 factor (ECF subfamily)
VCGPFNDEGADELVRLIEAAHHGSAEALGRLLEIFRPYLLLIANQEVAPDLQAKVGPSDLVQETFLEAGKDFGGFQGTGREELLAWLKSILQNNLANLRRRYRDTDKRRVNRELSLTDTPHEHLLQGLTDPGETPSELAIGKEEDEALERAIDRLPADYRQVIRWKKDEGCGYEEIGRRLGRSAEAARKLHDRAVDLLGELLEPPHDPG